MFQVFKNTNQLVKIVEDLVNQNKVNLISFDLFNTIFFRTVHPETIIHRACATEIKNQFKNEMDLSIEEILGLRNEAFNLLTNKTKEDCTFTELCGKWLELILKDKKVVTDEMVKSIVDYEFGLEREVIFADTAMVYFIREIQHKVKIVYTSDMYFHKSQIETLLKDSGLEACFSNGYLSSETGKLKRTGNMFKYLLKNEHIEPASILHIGDDMLIDGKMAVASGLNSFIINNTYEQKRILHLLKQYKHYNNSNDWGGALISACARQNQKVYDLFPYQYGYECLGIVFSSLVHKILERILEEKIEKVFFIARDGFVLQRIWENMGNSFFENKKNIPEAHYLCISRSTAFLASKPKLNKPDKTVLNLTSYDNSVRNVLGSFRINEQLLEKVAGNYSIDDIHTSYDFDLMEHKPFRNMLKDKRLNEFVNSQNETMHNNLYGYLKQSGFFSSDKIALVDVGWHASIQKFLYQAYGSITEYPEVFGFYLGLKDESPEWSAPKNNTEAIMANSFENFWNGNAGFNYIIAIEAFVRGPHGTTTGYNKKGRQFVPVMKDEEDESRVVEKKDDATIIPLQCGILDFSEQYSFFTKLFSIEADENLPFARQMLARCFRHPKTAEARKILPLMNVTDFGGFKVDQINRQFWDDPFHSLKLLSIVKKAEFWRNGVLAASSLPNLKYLYSIIQSHKYGKQNKSECLLNTKTDEVHSAHNRKRNKPASKWEHDFSLELDTRHAELKREHLPQTKSVMLDPTKDPLNITDHFLLELERIVVNAMLSVEGFETYKNDGISFPVRFFNWPDKDEVKTAAKNIIKRIISKPN